MFVSIILDTEYMGMGERHKWFLKNLSHAKENDWLVITHEHLGKHYQEYAENCAERFFDEFEMRRLSNEEYDKIHKGFVPDEIFENKENELGSRTELLMYLFQERYVELEQCLTQIIDSELKQRHGDKVEGIFNCLDCFASIRYLGDYYNCYVIPYVFSAIRKVHGYQQTLYMTSMDGSLYSCNEGRRRYNKFESEKHNSIIFSRRELLTIFGKEHNIPLLKSLNSNPKYEIGVCANAWSVNHDFLKFKYTDDDIYYESKKKFPMEKIITRVHPMGYDNMGVSRESLKNDPVSFILSCKRITGVCSQMLLKAILWNRAVYMKGEFLQFSFLCEKDVESEDIVDIIPLNYYILGYLVPSELMFDIEYWRWRIEKNPSEQEIYSRHLDFYLKYFELDSNIIHSESEKERFLYLLRKKSCAEDLIDYLLDEDIPNNINYDVLLSKLEVGSNFAVDYSLSRVNQYIEGKVYSEFIVDCKEKIDFLRFYPFVDVGGNAKINYIKLDSASILERGSFTYYSKKNGYEECANIDVLPGRHVIDVEWEYNFS